jgi:hypothetical protein
MTNKGIGRLTDRQVTEENFLRDVSKHTLTLSHDLGLYRHLRLAQPGTNNQAFEIITWPGYLCYCGDMGSFLFSRVPDMFTFFRDRNSVGPLDVNTGYWSEKVEARDRDGITEFSGTRFREQVQSYLEAAEASLEIRESVDDCVLIHADEEHEAYRAVNDFDEAGFSFTDFWETDCTVYTNRFLWCCYALPWAIRLYDAREQLRAAG